MVSFMIDEKFAKFDSVEHHFSFSSFPSQRYIIPTYTRSIDRSSAERWNSIIFSKLRSIPSHTKSTLSFATKLRIKSMLSRLSAKEFSLGRRFDKGRIKTDREVTQRDKFATKKTRMIVSALVGSRSCHWIAF